MNGVTYDYASVNVWLTFVAMTSAVRLMVLQISFYEVYIS